MTTLSSPKIALIKEEFTKEIQDYLKVIAGQLHVNRIRFADNCYFQKQIEDDGPVSLLSVTNKMHRFAYREDLFLTTPVFINYKGAVDKSKMMDIVKQLRYCDTRTVFWIEVHGDNFQYTVDILSNTNASFKIHTNIPLTKPTKGDSK